MSRLSRNRAATPPRPGGSVDRRRTLIIILLAMCTFAAFLPVFRNDFVNYDDPGYVYENPHVRSGLTPATIAWSFTTFQESNWHPLTWISHALDVTLFGVSAPAHHAMSLLLHLISAVLLFSLLDRITGDRWPSAFVALVFAIHPLHVESVVWISERKDVLSGLFFMLTLGAYAAYERGGGRAAYLRTIALFALGLMAKPMLVTIPFVLLLLDYWPLGRMPGFSARGREAGASAVPLRTILAEKIPFFILAGASSVVTYLAQERGGAIAEAGAVVFSDRAANAVTSYAAYLGKALFPVNLAFFYPHRLGDITGLEIGTSVIVLAAITAAVWRFGRTSPFLPAGWFLFLGMLVPVIGLVQVGLQSMADRYMYLPLIGLSVMAAWGLPSVLRPGAARAAILRPAFALAVVVMGALTWSQTAVWKDNDTLYNHALRVTEGNHIAHTNLGVTLTERGKDVEAIPHFREALRLWPRNFNNVSNLARSLGAVGEYEAALRYYRTILASVRHLPLLYFRVGEVFTGLGEADSALVYYARAVELDSTMLDSHIGLADLYSSRGEFEKARESVARIFRLAPSSPRGHDILGIVAGREGRMAEAEAGFMKAIAVDSTFDQAYVDLGILYEKTGRAEQSRPLYETAVRINPGNATALYQLGLALARDGDLGSAEREWLRSLGIQPGNAETRMALARLYTMRQQPDRAVAQYRALLAAHPARADAHFLLGNLLGARGDREGAERHYREALRSEPGFTPAADALLQLTNRPAP